MPDEVKPGEQKVETKVKLARLDYYEDYLQLATEPATKTPEGFLKAKAPVTNVGVFAYRDSSYPDGWRQELRLPEEVFAPESLESLKLKPLTELHPASDDPVTAVNFKDKAVGYLGNSIDTDSFRVYAPIMVTDAQAVEDVLSDRLSSLSCGYNCDLDYTSGTWMGVHYDCIQRNIRYNHVALVPAGRAGDDAYIRHDAADTGAAVSFIKSIKPNKEPRMGMKTLHLDGKDYQAEAEVIQALDESKVRLDAKEKDLVQVRQDLEAVKKTQSALEAERDSLKERLDAAEKSLPDKVQAGIKAHMDLADKARKAGVEFHADSDPRAVKKSIILSKFPKADLTGKDETYLQARLDAAMDVIDSQAENASRHDAADVPAGKPELTPEQELARAQARFNARMDSAWQDEPKTKEA